MLLCLDIDFFSPQSISSLEKAVCTIEKTFLYWTVAWFPYLSWVTCGHLSGLFRKEVPLSFIQICWMSPRMTVQASLFHEIIDLIELYLFFQWPYGHCGDHAIICRSESQRISIAVESKQLIHIIRSFSSALYSLIFYWPIHPWAVEWKSSRRQTDVKAIHSSWVF